jgi:hypothetical protein
MYLYLIVKHETAIEIFDAISTSELELKQELLHFVIRYARIRTDWYMADRGKRQETDRGRTITHNGLLDAVNALAGAMVKKGENTEWRQRMGDDRKEIGDWACHVHAHLGVLAR